MRPVTIDTGEITDFKQKKPEEIKSYSATEIDVALSSGTTVMDMVKDKNYKKAFNAIYGDERKRRALGRQILETADNILAKEGLFKSLSKSEAEQIAAVYIASQAAGRGIADKDTQLKDASPLTTNITEFEIFMTGAKLSPENPNFTLEQLLAFIPNFKEDDRKTNNGLNNPENLAKIYTTALEQIHTSDLNIDLKNEYIRNLNEEFNMDENMGIVPPVETEDEIKMPPPRTETITKKKILQDEEILTKYNISQNILNDLKNKFNKTTYQYNIPGKEDLIDIIDKEVDINTLIDLGYLTEGRSKGAGFRLSARRKFLKDLFTDLGLL